MLTKRLHLRPGQMVSVDRYIGSTPGRLPHTKGKEFQKDNFTSRTIFVNHASNFTYIKNHISLQSGETIVGKNSFKVFAKSFGVTIQKYMGDNHGTIRKLKARFCVRGDMQKEGIDYFDTFAPVVPGKLLD
jgi:hypothetical protein